MTDDLAERPRLLYQLVSPLHRTAGPDEAARRLTLLSAWAPGCDIRINAPEDGPRRAVESAQDIAMVVPHLANAARGWGAAGHQAVVIGCFRDPGVEALAEISGLPVIGPGRAGILAAMQLGERLSVLSSDPTPPGLRRRIRGIGAEPMFLSEVRVGGSVAALIADPDRHLPAIVAQARARVDAVAQVLVPGCFAISFAPGCDVAAAAAVRTLGPAGQVRRTARQGDRFNAGPHLRTLP